MKKSLLLIGVFALALVSGVLLASGTAAMVDVMNPIPYVSETAGSGTEPVSTEPQPQ